MFLVTSIQQASKWGSLSFWIWQSMSEGDAALFRMLLPFHFVVD